MAGCFHPSVYPLFFFFGILVFRDDLVSVIGSSSSKLGTDRRTQLLSPVSRLTDNEGIWLSSDLSDKETTV